MKADVNAPDNNVGADVGPMYIWGQPRVAVPTASLMLQVATVVAPGVKHK
jgi:hypothetical protein